MELRQKYSELLALPRARHPGSMFGMPLTADRSMHLAVDEEDSPVLLIAVSPHASESPPIGLRLANILADFALKCEISHPGGSATSGLFAVIKCRSGEDRLRTYFLRVMEGALDDIQTPATPRLISRLVDSLAELFRASSRPALQTSMGLWAELFLILTAAEPDILVDAWHHDPTERYDFSLGGEAVEVKSSGNRTRVHQFSFEQAWPPAGQTVLVASLFVERAQNGRSLGQLWEEVRSLPRLNLEARLRIEEACLRALGDSWADARADAFNWELAAGSLAFYRVNDIPRVGFDQPPEVFEINFATNLGGVRAVALRNLSNRNRLFQALAA